MNRRTLAAFLIFQLTGEIASWLGPRIANAAGPLLWVISVVFLLPGDFAATWLIEKFLWTSSLNLHQLQWFVKLPCELVINFAFWWLIAIWIDRLFGKSVKNTTH